MLIWTFILTIICCKITYYLYDNILLVYNRPPFHWTEQHDIMFCYEIRTIEPYQFKAGTRESGTAWEQIALNLNSLEKPKFSVNKRSVRDRYNVLKGNFLRNISNEEQSSGIDPENNELDQLLEEICACATEYERRILEVNETDIARKNQEQQTAEEMRRKSMETFAETAKRKGIEEPATGQKKKRIGGNQTVAYLREKLEKETEIRNKEIELRQAELQADRNKQIEMEKQQNRVAEQQIEVLKAFNTHIQNQFQQQQNQQQFSQAIIQSQQQQTNALMALIERMNKPGK